MVSVDALVVALWKPFVPQLASGEPVFFSFSSDLTASALEAFDLGSAGHMGAICNVADSLLTVGEIDVELRRNALTPGESGFSPAIILIAQQILAVEEMVNDPQGFTENAYFPRLRQLISPRMRGLSANPYAFHEFEKIWRVFASEIRGFPGSSEASITFRFDSARGANKAKALPLSQALLSREDLYALVRRIGHSHVKGAMLDRLSHLLRNESSQISRRCQKLIAFPNVRMRMAEQLRGFARTVPAERFENSSEGQRATDQLRLGIFKESIDWMNEGFFPFMFDDASKQRTAAGEQVHQAIHGALRGTPVMFLHESDFGDYWISPRTQIAIAAGDSILALAVGTHVDLQQIISGEIRAFLKLRSRGRLHEVSDCEVLEFEVQSTPDLGIAISRNSLLFGQDLGDKYLWIGGICVDRRRRLFLRDYLPQAVRFGDRELSISEMVAANGIPLTFSSFSSYIRNENAIADFSVEFPGGRVAKLAIGVNRSFERDCVGHTLLNSGRLHPVAERLSSNGPALVGFDSSSITRVDSLSTERWVQFLDALSRAPDSLPRQIEDMVVSGAIELERIPRSVKSMLRFIVRRADLLRRPDAEA